MIRVLHGISHIIIINSYIFKNVSFSTSHKKNSVFTFIRPYVFTRIYDPTLPLMLSPNYVSGSQPFSFKREGDGSLFCASTRRKFFLRLSMISWGPFYVTERFCDFLKRHNLLIKLQPWLTFLWKTFYPCLMYHSCIVCYDS